MRLADFAGGWAIDRIIEDVRSGRTGRLRGGAVFASGPEGLIYREEGSLRFGDGLAMSATRGYLWREAGDAIEVRFEDGRFFHAFDREAAAPQAGHDCPPDRYDVRYDFAAWPVWRVEWRVRGPRKDYGLVTSYRRM